MAEKEIGKVIHYFDRAMVAVVRLSSSLKTGDRVKIVKGIGEFEETVSSMQVEHESISAGKKGDEVAIKISQPTKEGAHVFKLE